VRRFNATVSWRTHSLQEWPSSKTGRLTCLPSASR